MTIYEYRHALKKHMTVGAIALSLALLSTGFAAQGQQLPPQQLPPQQLSPQQLLSQSVPGAASSFMSGCASCGGSFPNTASAFLIPLSAPGVANAIQRGIRCAGPLNLARVSIIILCTP
jgi:hypothetical protein